VGSACASGQKPAQAQAPGREIIGPVPAAPIRDDRFSSEDFHINVEERRAPCPAGKPGAQCGGLEEKESGKVNYRFARTGDVPDPENRETKNLRSYLVFFFVSAGSLPAGNGRSRRACSPNSHIRNEPVDDRVIG